MFISKQEKVSILLRLTVLEEMVKSIYKDRREVQEKKSAYGWTDEARAKHSERLKKSWADKRAAKAAA
jgi:hypothetical protein